MDSLMLFDRLHDELDKWSGDRIAEFWWRDDDAQKPGPALEQLIAISARRAAPLALAAIPDGVQAELAEHLTGRGRIYVLQHGFSHRNHAPHTERKMELGRHRSDEQICDEIVAGFNALEALFAEQFVPVMVPPWNRIAPELIKYLHAMGLRGLSTLGPRTGEFPVEGLKQVNVHVDIINWKQGRCFAGEAACIEQIVAHLSAKRQGGTDADEPTGIMSHHLVHDAGCWEFLDKLFGVLQGRPEARVLSAGEIF